MEDAPEERERRFVPPPDAGGKYPLIDCDPHILRVFRYARTSDYLHGGLMGISGPLLLLLMERVSPSRFGPTSLAPFLRLSFGVSAGCGFFYFVRRSSFRFYGLAENKREIEKDMREMVDKVKKGEPLYGKSQLTEYMQGVAARNSRYSALFNHVIPMVNMVNHKHHGVDTAKYYQQAERELDQDQRGVLRQETR